MARPLGALAAVLVGAYGVLAYQAHRFQFADLAIRAVIVLAFALVGVIVGRRRPRNPVGWLLLGFAILAMVASDAGLYLARDYRLHHGGLVGGSVAAFLNLAWIPAILLLPLPILLFPNGRLPSRRWRWSFWIYLALGGLLLAGLVVATAGAVLGHHVEVTSSGDLTLFNRPPRWLNRAQAVVIPALVVAWVAFVSRQVVGWRGSTGEIRQQLKWLMSGAAVSVAFLPVTLVAGNGSSALSQTASSVTSLGLAALPVSIGVGILKYRLYEIDRLISRTLSYAILTGLLAGVFVGIVVFTTDVLPFSSPVAVAASTLAAAALFNPLRGRVQHLVDRRFNRSRYDAEATVAAFTLRLRDAVDLDTVRSELLAAVDGAVKPAYASVWIRPPAPRSRA